MKLLVALVKCCITQRCTVHPVGATIRIEATITDLIDYGLQFYHCIVGVVSRHIVTGCVAKSRCSQIVFRSLGYNQKEYNARYAR